MYKLLILLLICGCSQSTRNTLQLSGLSETVKLTLNNAASPSFSGHWKDLEITFSEINGTNSSLLRHQNIIDMNVQSLSESQRAPYAGHVTATTECAKQKNIKKFSRTTEQTSISGYFLSVNSRNSIQVCSSEVESRKLFWGVFTRKNNKRSFELKIYYPSESKNLDTFMNKVDLL